MAAWLRMMTAVAVALVPGGFVLLFSFFTFRAVRRRWKLEAQAHGEVHMRDVLAGVRFRDVMAQMREAL